VNKSREKSANVTKEKVIALMSNASALVTLTSAHQFMFTLLAALPLIWLH